MNNVWQSRAGAVALASALIGLGGPASGAETEPDAVVATTAETAPGPPAPAGPAPDAAEARDWIGVPVLLKEAETALKIGKKVVVRNDLQRRFVVEKVDGDWLWVVSGNLKGWVKRGDVLPFDQAVRHFTAVIRSDPTAAWAYIRRALVWYEKREFDIALGDYTEALELEPKNAVARVNRGIALLAKRDFDGAIADFDAALQIEPRDASAYADRGLARLAKHDLDGAGADFDAALRFDPSDSAFHNYRGNARARQGRYRDAIHDYSEAIRLNPRDAWAYNSLAWLLATCPEARHRNGKGAVSLATQANELTGWRGPYQLGTMAAASAEAGDFDAAVKWQARALELFPKTDPDLDAHRARLESYRSKRAYHDESPRPGAGPGS